MTTNNNLFILTNTKGEITNYISDLYRKNNNGKWISPIKMQKTLYFLCAFWFSARENILTNFEYIDPLATSNELVKNLFSDSKLFEISFSAWKYGPVNRETYDFFKTIKSPNNISILALSFNRKLEVTLTKKIEEWFENYCLRIFATEDFALVNLSHNDKAWIEAINEEMGTPMSLETIENEYINKTI